MEGFGHHIHSPVITSDKEVMFYRTQRQDVCLFAASRNTTDQIFMNDFTRDASWEKDDTVKNLVSYLQLDQDVGVFDGLFSIL